MAKLNKTVTAALAAIQATGRVTADVGKPLVEQGLIEVNTEDVVNDMAAARLTQKGLDGMGTAKPASAPTGASTGGISLITGYVPPESKRGFGRKAGPSKYPFETLQVNGSFFVSNDEVGGSALKKLGSVVSNAANKHRVATGEMKSVTRAKRDGKKAMTNPDGTKVMEEVNLPVYNYPVKFIIRGVKAGEKYGEWAAPSDGAVITRTK